jgi:ribosomal protein S18 acetylase RimI-like enzyme
VKTTQHTAAFALRQVADSDDSFLRALVIADRSAQFMSADLDLPTLTAILELQYTAQREAFATAYPTAVHELLEHDGAPIGRIITAADGGGLRLVDILIGTSHRGRGAGSWLLGRLCAQADAAQLAVTLSVWQQNTAAQRLYRRFGFRATADQHTGYLIMRRCAIFFDAFTPEEG